MEAIAWTTQAVLRLHRKPGQESIWVARIQRVYSKHGYVTADMLCEVYKTTRENARKRLWAHAKGLGLRVIRKERVPHNRSTTYVYGKS